MSGMDTLRGGVREARNALIVASAYDTGRAIQLEYECGGETMLSALLRFRAVWIDLFAAMLGHRS